MGEVREYKDKKSILGRSINSKCSDLINYSCIQNKPLIPLPSIPKPSLQILDTQEDSIIINTIKNEDSESCKSNECDFKAKNVRDLNASKNYSIYYNNNNTNDNDSDDKNLKKDDKIYNNVSEVCIEVHENEFLGFYESISGYLLLFTFYYIHFILLILLGIHCYLFKILILGKNTLFENITLLVNIVFIMAISIEFLYYFVWKLKLASCTKKDLVKSVLVVSIIVILEFFYALFSILISRLNV